MRNRSAALKSFEKLRANSRKWLELNEKSKYALFPTKATRRENEELQKGEIY